MALDLFFRHIYGAEHEIYTSDATFSTLVYVHDGTSLLDCSPASGWCIFQRPPTASS